MANGIEIASYDPKKVSVIINGKEITNFGPDSVISVTEMKTSLPPGRRKGRCSI